MIINVSHQGKILATIIKSSYSKEGISFFTPDEFSQQLAYMEHKAGHDIAPHVHNEVHRDVFFTQEVLVIRKGILRVDFYSDNKDYFESHSLSAGDVILLASGGHGFKVIEDLEMFEIKQGPYSGERDKTRFPGISPESIQLKG